jgi:hypothetical protein
MPFHLQSPTMKTKSKSKKIIAGTANAKFESLKNQIDPHFLLTV